ncbi:MAG: hypothetical protein ACJAWW_001541 [Sulfurimonas sp.]|jgi:hypothetical protein
MRILLLILISFSFSFAKVVVDKKTDFMWQDNLDAKSVQKNWQGAKNYCEALTLEGYNDWFLPRQEQLLTISDKTKYNPAIKEEFKNVASSYYWSSSTYVSIPEHAWGVYFKHGNSYYDDKQRERFVRCVRSAKSK